MVDLKGRCLSRLSNNELVRIPADGAPDGMTIDNQNRLWIYDPLQKAIY
ncbi:MAG: hypothetical protein LLG13_17830 [Bacteroidales bacterium]|nr:hypothetical protein [Bacteroidales bacterium]